MKSSLLMDFTVDWENRKINVKREFAASVSKVWAAWTEPELLDQWWAPKPWKAQTKAMDFRVGGYWLYAMVGPDDTTHWSRADFQKISVQDYFTSRAAFCDENGNQNNDFPEMDWKVEFSPATVGTQVQIEIRFETEEDIKTIIEMGFKEGFTSALENLDEIEL